MKVKIILIGLLSFFVFSCQSGKKQGNENTAKQETFAEVSFQVSGMHCDMCVASIEKGVGQLAGVDSVKAILNDSLAYVRFNPGMVSEDEISKTIELRGYKVKGKL